MNYVKNTTILFLAALTTTGCIADDTDSYRQNLSGSETLPSVTQPNRPTGAFGRTGLLFDTTCDVILDEIKTIALEEVTPWGLESDYWMIEERIDMEVEESVAASEMSVAGRFSGATSPRRIPKRLVSTKATSSKLMASTSFVRHTTNSTSSTLTRSKS